MVLLDFGERRFLGALRSREKSERAGERCFADASLFDLLWMRRIRARDGARRVPPRAGDRHAVSPLAGCLEKHHRRDFVDFHLLRVALAPDFDCHAHSRIRTGTRLSFGGRIIWRNAVRPPSTRHADGLRRLFRLFVGRAARRNRLLPQSRRVVRHRGCLLFGALGDLG